MSPIGPSLKRALPTHIAAKQQATVIHIKNGQLIILIGDQCLSWQHLQHLLAWAGSSSAPNSTGLSSDRSESVVESASDSGSSAASASATSSSGSTYFTSGLGCKTNSKHFFSSFATYSHGSLSSGLPNGPRTALSVIMIHELI
jgi:hypothetical protein